MHFIDHLNHGWTQLKTQEEHFYVALWTTSFVRVVIEWSNCCF